MKFEWFGRVEYTTALKIQEEFFHQVLTKKNIGTLLLMEHEPVYTIGRTADNSSLCHQDKLPYSLYRTNRGGKATYHGPGQLIGYPILDITLFNKDISKYLRFLEKNIIQLLLKYHIVGKAILNQTGVWVKNKKIASIAVGIRKWISMHGFAMNVNNDLFPFENIIPCGIHGICMTSMIQESTFTQFSIEKIAHQMGNIFLKNIDDLHHQYEE